MCSFLRQGGAAVAAHEPDIPFYEEASEQGYPIPTIR
jgi:hypothetical protein